MYDCCKPGHPCSYHAIGARIRETGSAMSEQGRALRPGEFRAVCRQIIGGKPCNGGEFDDPAAFEAHMRTVHHRKPYASPTVKPYAWKAPRAPRDASGLAAVLAKYAGHEFGTVTVEPTSEVA